MLLQIATKIPCPASLTISDPSSKSVHNFCYPVKQTDTGKHINWMVEV